MKNSVGKNFKAAIDIGTTKIVTIIAKTNHEGHTEILGIGKHPSYGLKKGVIVNINKTVESIAASVQEAQAMAGVQIEDACVGISGGHIQSYNSTGVVAVKSKEISQEDIDRVIDAAKAIPLPQDQQILHVLPQYFKVDGQEYVYDSLGMYGVRLEAHVHIIAGAVASAQNIIRSCELAGVEVSDIVLEQLASATAVLTPAEQEMGVGILDIGGGTSDFALYKDGRIRHSKVIAIAGNHFTNDIAVGLNIPFEKAEELKKMYGSVLSSRGQQYLNSFIDIDLGYQDGVRTLQVSTISEIMNFRAEELLDLYVDEINQFKLKNLMPCGLVLTGGGSLLDGMKELAAEKLGMPVRVGYPLSPDATKPYLIPDALCSPIYATAYGLLLHATGEKNVGEVHESKDAVFTRVLKRMKSWIYDLF